METRSTSLLKHLNKKQREAVERTDGPILVLAGPGSGKTRTLTHRIAYLITHHQIAPSEILAVTFTNKAAGEMQNRIKKLLASTDAPSTHSPFIGTFHRFCVRLLHRHAELIGFAPSFVIYDADDQERLLKQLMKEEDIDKKRYPPSRISAAISHAKNTLQSVEESLKGRGPFQDIATRMAERYQSALQQSNAMDFDDLILFVVRLLQKK